MASHPALRSRHRPGPDERKADATTWDGLARLAFASDWDPDRAIDWARPVGAGEARDAWIALLHTFYAGEWQGLEIIERLMNRAAHLFGEQGMVTYYATQCYDEAKHLYVFRRYLEKLGAPPAPRPGVDLLVQVATRGPFVVERWILATYFTETLAAAVLKALLGARALDETARAMIRLMLKDESRHIAGTRLGVSTVLGHAGPLKLPALRAWWGLFARLAVREARRLAPDASKLGVDAEEVLRQTFARMARLPRFARAFLGVPSAGELAAETSRAVP